MRIELKRIFKKSTITLGILHVFDDLNSPCFTCWTLELPDKKNAKQISCIPTGSYTCRRGMSEKANTFGGETYRVLDVPNRTGIMFHAGNSTGDTQGCILLGYMAKIKDETILESTKACAAFMAALNGQIETKLRVI